MKITVLKDDIQGNITADDADNAIEADFVAGILTPKHTVSVLPFGADMEKNVAMLKAAAPDIVFNLVESVARLGALSPMATLLLETLNIPFTGNKTPAHLVSADKALCKKVLENAGVLTPTSRFVRGKTYLLKAKTEHASIGLDDSCFVTPVSEDALAAAIVAKEKETGRSFVAEEYIDGREFNAAILDDMILAPAEIVFSNDFPGQKILTYDAKWDENSPAYCKSVRSFDIEPGIIQNLVDMTLKTKAVCGLKGYARVDYRRDAQGNLYVIDINTNPCISPDSGFIAMVERTGLTKEQAIERIVQNAFVPD